MDSIKNIVFDFGGVLIDLDYQKTYDAFSELICEEFHPDTVDDALKQKMLDFETGKISAESFLWNIQKKAQPNQINPLDIINAWNAMLLGWKIGQFQILYQLRNYYQIYLLSNTNEIHIDYVHMDLKQKYGIYNFEEEFFEKVYYSHKLGLRKPDKAIFHHVIQDAEIRPEETLFIDDLPENIETAKELGFQVLNHPQNAPIDHLLKLPWRTK
jgi:epoxide hydrolase-like predicted phosphatase